MELERKQAETNYQQLSHDVKNHQQVSSPYVEPGLPTANQPGPDSSNREGDGLRLQAPLFPYMLLQVLLFKSAVYVHRIYFKVAIFRGSM